jgi:hypothetical protein
MYDSKCSTPFSLESFRRLRTFLILVDSHSLIRGYYDGTKKEEVDKLFKDVSKVLKER